MKKNQNPVNPEKRSLEDIRKEFESLWDKEPAEPEQDAKKEPEKALNRMINSWVEMLNHWTKASDKATLEARIFELYKQELANAALPGDLAKQYDIFHDSLASATNAALYFEANVDEFSEKVAAVLEQNKPEKDADNSIWDGLAESPIAQHGQID